MRPRAEAYFLIFILLLMLAFVGLSFTYEKMIVKLLPIIVGTTTFILAVIALWQEIAATSKRAKPLNKQSLEGAQAGDFVKGISFPLGWLVGFIMGIFLLGYTVATPLFITAYLKARGWGWCTIVIFAVAMWGVVYGAFELLLKTELYEGLIWHWITG